MNKFIKQLRILLAIPILALGNWIDARDRFDLEAEMMRLDPNFTNPKKSSLEDKGN